MSHVLGRWYPIALLAIFAAPTLAAAADQPQWGRAWSRNMVSDETDLPDDFDTATGRNVKWTAELGSQSYATPVVAGGRVLIGTNNDNPRDPRHRGDRAVLLCLGESDGRLLWQLVVPKLSEDLGDPYLDLHRHCPSAMPSMSRQITSPRFVSV